MVTHLVAQVVGHEVEVGRAGDHDVEHEDPAVVPPGERLVHAVARVRGDVLLRLGRLVQVDADELEQRGGRDGLLVRRHVVLACVQTSGDVWLLQ